MVSFVVTDGKLRGGASGSSDEEEEEEELTSSDGGKDKSTAKPAAKPAGRFKLPPEWLKDEDEPRQV